MPYAAYICSHPTLAPNKTKTRSSEMSLAPGLRHLRPNFSEFLIKSDSKNKKTNRKGAHKESDPKGPLMGAPLGHMSNSSGHLCQARRKSDGNAETIQILLDWAGRLSRNNISQRSGGMEMAA